ncbi:hypothetical protein cyc_01732 [Cyclospora cayetanensis]|uniref:Uncharacterized protein n=1 Tax=Cyclospora cayetanensis TaxID=88456 RepID=A0A1D3CS32_9EIME|nr:hypothetical protein cyc_01732 [Cyclospora cayetanensis]
MADGGWLSGWISRVLQPFAPGVPRKRKVLNSSETEAACGLLQPSTQLAAASKRQRLAPSQAPTLIDAIHHNSQCYPLQPQRRCACRGAQSLQPGVSHVARAPHSSERALKPPASSGDSDASFASVPSGDEREDAQKLSYKGRPPLLIGKAEAVQQQWGAQCLHRQPHRRAPPMPLQPVQQNQQQQRAFSSLLPNFSASKRGLCAGTRLEEAPRKGLTAALLTTETTAAETSTQAASRGGSSGLRPLHTLSRESPCLSDLWRPFGRVSPALSLGFTSRSTSALPELPHLCSTSQPKSSSTSALPPLSSAPSEPPEPSSAVTKTIADAHRDLRHQQKLLQLLMQSRSERQSHQQPQKGKGQARLEAQHAQGIRLHPENPRGIARGSGGSNNNGISSIGVLPGAWSQAGGCMQDRHDASAPPPTCTVVSSSAVGGGSVASTPVQAPQGAPMGGPLERRGSVVDASKGLFCSPTKTGEDALLEGGQITFGHRVLRPLVSKDPAENYDAFLDILRQARKQ